MPCPDLVRRRSLTSGSLVWITPLDVLEGQSQA